MIIINKHKCKTLAIQNWTCTKILENWYVHNLNVNNRKKSAQLKLSPGRKDK